MAIFDLTENTTPVTTARVAVQNSSTGTTDSVQLVNLFAGRSITLGTPVAATSGTSIDFTGIAAGRRRITINFAGVSTDATSPIIVQLGDAGGVETTGYLGAAVSLTDGSVVGGTTLSSGFMVGRLAGAPSLYNGSLVLDLEDSSDFTWTGRSLLGKSDALTLDVCGGRKALSAELDRVRITTAGGTANFDAGEINIASQG